MSEAKVQRQVERILEEGSGRTRSVIVRMRGATEVRDDFIAKAAGAVGRSSLLVSARDLLPQQREHLGGRGVGKLSEYRRRKLAEQHASVVAQVTAAQLTAHGRATLRKNGERSLKPLLAHEAVKSSLAREEERVPKDRQPKRTFWTSRSVALRLREKELQAMAADVKQIADVHPNRTLEVPRVLESERLPPEIVENQAGTWGLRTTGAMAVWGAYGARGAGVTVAVLDTGVDASHPDLRGKVNHWAEFDFDGRQVEGSTAHDSDEHGTHVAGTIAGGNAGGKWIGMAPEAKIAGVLVLKGGSGTDAQILAGIDWALDQGVQVINMSLGGLTLDAEVPSTYAEAIVSCLRAGVPVVTAIGNEGSQTSGTPGNDLFAFAVGATDYRDRAAGFSGGRTHIIRESDFLPPDLLPMAYSKPEVSAPGVNVESSVPGGEHKAFNGTSMATPHVAGAIALLLSAAPRLGSVSPVQRGFTIMELIKGSVEELGESGQDHRFGFGRLDALRAVAAAKERGF